MSDPKQIWMSPVCHEDGDGRLWCCDDVWGDDCGCGTKQHSSVKYVLASDYDRLEQECDRAAGKLRTALLDKAQVEAERDTLAQECERLRLDNLSKNGSIKAMGEQIAKLQRAVKNRDRMIAKAGGTEK